MKESGIHFTPDNHRLIMSGAKVQTRRVIKANIDGAGGGHYHGWTPNRKDIWPRYGPYGVPGDRLYVKEGVIVYEDALEVTQLSGYYMDGCRATKPDEKRLTAMFMAKRFART